MRNPIMPVNNGPSPALSSKPNRRFKDTVFRDLFGSQERKDYALSLYNALAGTDYEDPAQLELNTLDDVIYMGMRNDISFLIGTELVLLEHQSSPNANMPLRGLFYFSRLYEMELARRGSSVHTRSLIRLPRPRFIVLYNGAAGRPDRYKQRLSDAFDPDTCEGGTPAVEVVAEVVNVNEGRNPKLEEDCEALAGYAHLVAKTREFCATMTMEEAISAAIDECVARGLLVDYLTGKRAEVASMYLTEWDEEAFRENLRRESLEEGREKERARIAVLLAECGVDQSVIERVSPIAPADNRMSKSAADWSYLTEWDEEAFRENLRRESIEEGREKERAELATALKRVGVDPALIAEAIARVEATR